MKPVFYEAATSVTMGSSLFDPMPIAFVDVAPRRESAAARRMNVVTHDMVLELEVAALKAKRARLGRIAPVNASVVVPFNSRSARARVYRAPALSAEIERMLAGEQRTRPASRRTARRDGSAIVFDRESGRRIN